MVSKENPTHILKVKGNGQDTANTFISQDLYYTCILRNLVGDGKKKSVLLPFFFLVTKLDRHITCTSMSYKLNSNSRLLRPCGYYLL